MDLKHELGSLVCRGSYISRLDLQAEHLTQSGRRTVGRDALSRHLDAVPVAVASGVDAGASTAASGAGAGGKDDGAAAAAAPAAGPRLRLGRAAAAAPGACSSSLSSPSAGKNV